MKVHTSILLGSLCLFLLAGPPSSLAATTNVKIVDFAFQPADVTIKVGDTVTWTNTGLSEHTTTSGTTSGGVRHPDSLWDSGPLLTGRTFSHTFTKAGAFPYYCNFHFTSMVGMVTVQAAVSEPPAGSPGGTTTAPSFFDIFMDIAGIPGESTNALHKSSIEVMSWSWGVSQTSAGGTSAIGRELSGHVTLIKRIDKATPLLFKQCVGGTVLPLVTVQLTRADGQTFLKYELKNVMISSISHGGDLDGDGLPDETIELSLGGAKLTYTQFDAAGKVIGQTSAEW
jgi:type VI secretion system secreted protein Hcp